MSTERKNKIKQLGFDPNTVYYHGTNVPGFENFEIKDKTRSQNVYGNGIYFTKKPKIANIYSDELGGNIIPVHLKLTKELPKDGTLSDEHIKNLIIHSPNVYHKNNITSLHGDKFDLDSVINKIKNKDKTPLDQLHRIKDLFYRDIHAKHFLNNVIKHTGYDHHKVDDEFMGEYTIVYHPTQIRSIFGKFEKEHTNKLSESIEILFYNTLWQ